MKCPFCRSPDTQVYNSRGTRHETQIWRRRRCQTCHEAFTTYEAPDLGFLKVVKKNGLKQRYSRAKLYSGIYGAFLSVPQKEMAVDAVTDTVEAALLDTKRRELATSEIAAVVLAALKQVNLAAFMRFLAYHANPATPAELRRALKPYMQGSSDLKPKL